MGIIKNLEKLNHMHFYLKSKSTGTPDEFANRIGVSRSHLYECLDEMRSLGADVKYSRTRQSFYYNNDFEIVIIITSN